MDSAPTDAAVAAEPEAQQLDAAARARLEADMRLTMAQRLAKRDALCQQLTAIARAVKRS